MRERESSVSFAALGSIAVVAVAEAARLAQARAAVEETVAAFDLACSRFRDDSELCALNAAAGSELRVTPLLLEATLTALRAAQLTDGDVDPTVGQALIALGYDRDFDALHSAAARARQISIVPAPGWRAVQVDETAGTIRVPSGVTLDLGATAKALAADRAAMAARAAAECGVLVGLGGDIAIGGPAPAGGWRVRVTDDHRAGTQAPGQWIALHSGGLATSSTTTRRWQAGAHAVHHLVDPATGAPVDAVWRTVSVTAGSCLDANIASTAAVIRGHGAAGWLALLGLPSRLVRADGRVRHLAGWPADGDDLVSDELDAVA
jgi:thiamine biosynthesis lipoprotein